jgi:predicted phosphoribosyltransferase
LICAVPVASAEALSRVRPLADEVVCLHVPIDLHSIGQHYQEFNEVSDADVMALLSSMKNG